MGKAEQNFEAQREATLGSPHAEASRMLEAALQQMDGIISGWRPRAGRHVSAAKRHDPLVVAHHVQPAGSARRRPAMRAAGCGGRRGHQPRQRRRGGRRGRRRGRGRGRRGAALGAGGGGAAGGGPAARAAAPAPAHPRPHRLRPPAAVASPTLAAAAAAAAQGTGRPAAPAANPSDRSSGGESSAADSASTSDDDDDDEDDDSGAERREDEERAGRSDRGTTGCAGDFQWLRSKPGATLAPPPPPHVHALSHAHAKPPSGSGSRASSRGASPSAGGGSGGGGGAGGARRETTPRSGSSRGVSATPPPQHPGGGAGCGCGGGSRSNSLERGRARRHEHRAASAAAGGSRHRGCCGSTSATLPAVASAGPGGYCMAAHCCHGHAPCLSSWESCCCVWRSRSLCRWEHALPPPYSQPSSDVEERVRRLEADKESLQLQVAVLSEQIEVQTEKIADLEKALDEKKQQLSSAENMLQTEMLARSSLETHKLELLSGISELKLQQAAIERENLELRERLSEERRRNKPPLAPRSVLHATSTPFSSPSQNAQLLVGASPSPSPVSSMSDGSPRRLGNEEIPQPRTPPANFRRKVDHYGSLPRQRTGSGSSMPPLDPNLLVSSGRKGVAFAETERVVIDDQPAVEEENNIVNSFSPQPSPLLQPQKNKGIKKIFGRIKRSNSGTLEDLPGEGEFRRGGVRATAGARLGWGTAPTPAPKPDLPFSQWDSEAISQWLSDLGLECYANDARRWVKTGAQLLSASTHEIDKELGIKSPIHRKKLQLALLCEAENGIVKPEDPHLLSAGRLDTAWVLRWLDDVGLPQHKESFLAARVDGRVLHRLTVDDLALLHLSSSLHVASLRRGIQVLRDHGFDPNCLLRRSLPDETGAPTPQDVARWTNHRVMEWLRVVDLAEYAPNLRGSGVHGGLMVHEPRFTAELLASLLSIPPSKTLLRRHLNTHFKELLGRECIQEKREAEATLGYVPLSATTKVKLAKKSQFTLKRKKSKAELDMGDLVCPLDPSKPGEGSPQTPPLHLHGDGISPASKAPKAGVASQGTDTNSLAESSASDRTSTV